MMPKEPSFGIVPFVRVGKSWCVFLQISFSASLKNFKVDPLRGQREPQEKDTETAARETLEESALLLDIPSNLLDDGFTFEGLHFVRVIFEEETDLLECPKIYDSNRSILEGLNNELWEQARECDGIAIEPITETGKATLGGLRFAKEVNWLMKHIFSRYSKISDFPNQFPRILLKRTEAENGIVTFKGGPPEQSTISVSEEAIDLDLPEGDDWRYSPSFHNEYTNDQDRIVGERRIQDKLVYPEDYCDFMGRNGYPILKREMLSRNGPPVQRDIDNRNREATISDRPQGYIRNSPSTPTRPYPSTGSSAIIDNRNREDTISDRPQGYIRKGPPMTTRPYPSAGSSAISDDRNRHTTFSDRPQGYRYGPSTTTRRTSTGSSVESSDDLDWRRRD